MGTFDIDFDFDFDFGDFSAKPTKKDDPQTTATRTHRRKSALYEVSQKYEYRRAFSETKLLDLCDEFRFQSGVSYNFITGGDIDSLSFLKAIIRAQKKLHHIICSTWCMAGEDILQLREWHEKGTIELLDMYVGEIFPSSYKIEWNLLNTLYSDYPKLGHLRVFRNHSKIYAGYGDEFYFGIQSSANINTNPRTEQACITIDKGIYEFYKAYFDGIHSICDTATDKK